MLGLSTLQPRKNYPRLIRAFHIARQEAALPHLLVIGGKKGWLFEEIFATVRELKMEKDVVFPGFVADEDLPALYSAADFFVYPSLYEGFGLPVLESLACGTPVLTADNSCLPEAGGEGALYVDAESVESIADGIEQLSAKPELRTRLAAAGAAPRPQFHLAAHPGSTPGCPTSVRLTENMVECFQRARKETLDGIESQDGRRIGHQNQPVLPIPSMPTCWAMSTAA